MAGAWGAGLTCGWGAAKKWKPAFRRGDFLTKSGSVGGARWKDQASGAWQTTSMLYPSGPMTNAA